MPRGALIACHECDLLQRTAPLAKDVIARCRQCFAVLDRPLDDNLDRPLAYTLAAAVLFVIANVFPIVGLELQGKRIAREGAVVKVSGKPVGTVTSGTYAPTLQKSIAMAYIHPALTEVGTRCMVDIRGKDEAATVVALPFYKRTR